MLPFDRSMKGNGVQVLQRVLCQTAKVPQYPAAHKNIMPIFSRVATACFSCGNGQKSDQDNAFNLIHGFASGKMFVKIHYIHKKITLTLSLRRVLL